MKKYIALLFICAVPLFSQDTPKERIRNDLSKLRMFADILQIQFDVWKDTANPVDGVRIPKANGGKLSKSLTLTAGERGAIRAEFIVTLDSCKAVLDRIETLAQ